MENLIKYSAIIFVSLIAGFIFKMTSTEVLIYVTLLFVLWEVNK
jgi:hypothetical protein